MNDCVQGRTGVLSVLKKKRLRSCALWMGAACLGIFGGATDADEPLQAFAEGLRSRGFFDTALEYLAEQESDNKLSPETRAEIPLERGITYREMGSNSRVPEDRNQFLSQAESALQAFTSASPNHPRAAYAFNELGKLLIDRARTLIWDADSPSNEENQGQMRQQARGLLQRSRQIFQQAYDKYLQEFKTFPNFIDRAQDPKQYEARQKAEVRYLRARLSLAECTYEEGQTYPESSPERQATLGRALTQFEEIHSDLRSTPIGLQARLMMGKCLQEQGNIGGALGMYAEVRSTGSETPAAKRLSETALQFELICLNLPERADYQVVVQKASRWLDDNRVREMTPARLGIMYERAFAAEKLAADRTLTGPQREAVLRQALKDTERIGRSPGPYRRPANVMQRRLKAALGDQDEEPRDFDTAFERARGMIDQIAQLRKAVEDASGADKATQQAALEAHLGEVGRLLELALRLRAPTTEARAIAQARYLLSFVMLRQQKSYDAYILARHCMTRDREADRETAENATEIAITAAVQAWNRADTDNREFEANLIREVCLEVVDLYPNSRRGNEARMRLGNVYRQLDQPLEAARWFLEVGQADAGYPSARIQAGQAYLTAWLQETASRESGLKDGHSTEDLEKWLKESRTLLEQGLQLARQRSGNSGAWSEEVVAAEFSLVRILNTQGEYQVAIDRVTAGGEKSVLATLNVEGERPSEGVRSAEFAGMAYRLMLRAYVGAQKIEAAIQTMTQLKGLGGRNITAVYTQLGQELQSELQRLQDAGETEQLSAVRGSFEQFLDQVYQQRDPSDYTSLVWIGETYFGLGQGSDDATAAGYYTKAGDAFSQILDGNLVSESSTELAIQSRLVRCLRFQKQYAEAVQLANTVLSQSPLALDVQFEAAGALSDWGENGEPERLLQSIEGETPIWGWAQLSRRLEQAMSGPDGDEFQERFYDARYELSRSRMRYVQASGTTEQKQLSSAMAEIATFAMVQTSMPDAEFTRFDRLYRDVQAEMGREAKPLLRPEKITPVREPAVAETSNDSPSVDERQTQNTLPVSAADEGESSIVLPLIAVLVAAGGGGAFFFLMRKPTRRAPIVRTAVTPGQSPAPDFAAFDVTESGTAPVAPTAGTRRPAASPAAAAAGEPRKRMRPAAGKAAQTGERGSSGDGAADGERKRVRKRRPEDGNRPRKKKPRPPGEGS